MAERLPGSLDLKGNGKENSGAKSPGDLGIKNPEHEGNALAHGNEGQTPAEPERRTDSSHTEVRPSQEQTDTYVQNSEPARPVQNPGEGREGNGGDNYGGNPSPSSQQKNDQPQYPLGSGQSLSGIPSTADVNQVSRFGSVEKAEETEENLVVSDELKGRNAEDIAANKSNATVKTSNVKWKVTDENPNTATASERQTSGNKHKATDGSSEAFHSTTEAPESRYKAWDDGDVRDNAEFTAKDVLGREATTAEKREQAHGHSKGKSAIDKGNLFGKKENAREKKATEQNVNVGRAAEGGVGGGIGGGGDGPNAKDKDKNGGFTKDVNDKGKIAFLAKDVSKVHKKHGAVNEAAQIAQQTVESQYQESDYAQGAQEAKKDAKDVAFITGATAIAHAGTRANIHAEMTQDSIFTTKKSRSKREDAIKAAEDATGGKFVTSTKNSYGSLTKDVQNNERIIDNYFKKKGLDISGYSEKDFEKAIKFGKLKNKIGADAELSEKDKELLKERLKLLKREKAMKACGTWRDDAREFLENTYRESDAYQGYKQVKTGAKDVKTGVRVGKAAVTGIADAGIDAVASVKQNANRLSYIKDRVTGKGLPKGADKKARKKWRADERLKYRDKKSKIKIEAGRKKTSAAKVISTPIVTAGRGIGRDIGKLTGATIGKTRFGQSIGNAAKGIRDAIQSANKRRLEVINKIKNNKVTKFLGAPFRAVGKIVDAFNFIKKVIIIAGLMLILTSVVLVLITSIVAAIIPSGADESNFEDRQTLWEDAKAGINEELQSISNDSVGWIQKNYRAYRKNRFGKTPSYATDFVFSGFEFTGPANLVSDRGDDVDAEIANYSTKLKEAQDEGEKTVPDKATAVNGPFSGQSGTLTKRDGTNDGPSGKETFYNLDLANCVHTLDLHCKGKGNLSNTAHYFVRKDGVECYGDEDPKKGAAYVLVASNNSLRPKGTIVMTSLGPGIVADACAAAKTNPKQLDIAVTWQTKGRPNKDKFGTKNSGTIDTWGSDLNSGAAYVDGKTACSSNYLRSILAMVTNATGNEDDPDNTEFYTNYCRHIVRNSYYYSQYVAAKKWISNYGDSKDKQPANDPDDPYLSQVYLDEFAEPAFSMSIMDKEYDPLTGVLIRVTFSYKLRFLDCGLWGDNQYDNKDYKDDGTKAGQAQQSTPATGVGLFDVETYDYSTKDACGKPVNNEVCNDDYLHSLIPKILFGKGKSSEYEILDKNADGYETWDGWEENTDIGNVGSGKFIYESGSNTSMAEATYDIPDEDYADMGITFDGVYNIDNSGADEGDNGSGSSTPLTPTDIQTICSNVSTTLGKNDSQKRQAVINKGLELCGHVRYKWGGAWDSNTSDEYVKAHGLDCAAFISYIVYKGGADNCPFSVVQHTAQLAELAGNSKYRVASKDKLRPGDVLVKRGQYKNSKGESGYDSHGNYASHAVMYIGSTSKGAFTILEESGSRGAHLSYYSSPDAFFKSRGGESGYQYILNFYGD